MFIPLQVDYNKKQIKPTFGSYIWFSCLVVCTSTICTSKDDHTNIIQKVYQLSLKIENNFDNKLQTGFIVPIWADPQFIVRVLPQLKSKICNM